MTVTAGASVIRKRREGLQVQVFAGRKRWLSRQVPGQTKAAYRQAKKVDAQLLEQVDRGELIGLKWRDVDLGRGEVLIASGVVRVAGRSLIDKDTKTHAKRRIAVGASTIELLRAQRARQAKAALASGTHLAPDGYVFSRSADGSSAISPGGITHRFQELAAQLGVRARLHDLRHFMVTQLIAGGVDWRTVSGRAEHADGHTTLATYAHFQAAQDRQAAELMERLLAFPTGGAGRSGAHVEADALPGWAEQHAGMLLAGLSTRWHHVQGVVRQAQRIMRVVREHDRSYLIAAAWLHDIGYAPSLAATAFHPLDGARYVRSLCHERLARLIAYHSSARWEADTLGLGDELAAFPREDSATADALTYCDMTTSPTGQTVTMADRLAEIAERHGPDHLVVQCLERAHDHLLGAARRTEKRIQAVGPSD
jgi:Phage integrase family/HD domain